MTRALLACAQKYYAQNEGHSVAKAFVDCEDVREGACIRTSVKVSHYEFDMQKKLHNVALYTKKLRRRHGTGTPPPPGSPPGKSDSEKMFSLVGISPMLGVKSATSALAHSHKQGLCPVPTPLSPGPVAPDKIVSCSSPLVTRTRPSIPSNSRGKIYATAVETGPVHVVACMKGKSIKFGVLVLAVYMRPRKKWGCHRILVCPSVVV